VGAQSGGTASRRARGCSGKRNYSFTERLAEHLGYPERDPHGASIPAADESLPIEDALPLSRAEAGRRVRVLRMAHEGAPTLAHLGERNLVPGSLLTVEEARPLDGVVTVRGEDGISHSLGQSLAGAIFVQSLS
jgi:DtxR family Mn-dependent transcriptional regulator